MAITRQKKEALVAEYVERLSRSEALLVSEYRGLSVKQFQALRQDLRESDSEIVVAKNTLMARALQEAEYPVPDALLTGPTAITFCYSDLAGPAKALRKHAKDTKILVIQGGLLGEQELDAAAAEALADLPSREQLLTQVVGTMQAPISGLVNVLAGTIRGVVNVLNARIDQMEEAA